MGGWSSSIPEFVAVADEDVDFAEGFAALFEGVVAGDFPVILSMKVGAR